MSVPFASVTTRMLPRWSHEKNCHENVFDAPPVIRSGTPRFSPPASIVDAPLTRAVEGAASGRLSQPASESLGASDDSVRSLLKNSSESSLLGNAPARFEDGNAG